jgi:SAM-dependent methyltransferase
MARNAPLGRLGSMPVHRVARVGFSLGAAEYDRGRPEYPIAAIEFVRRTLQLGERSRIAELGAGTGKLTTGLLSIGLHPVALEPVPEMRARLRATLPDLAILGGVAEAIPLRSGSVDAVLAAQSFHWFDVARALQEIARVLRPGGGLALLWNVRDESISWQAEMTRLLERYRPLATPSHRDRAWRESLHTSAEFGPV